MSDDGDPSTRHRWVDALLPDDWAEDDAARLEQWKQGHALEGGAIFFAGAPSDDVTGRDAQALWETLEYGDPLDWSIVVSQTCDIGASGPGARHPFVQCAPLICIDDRDETFRRLVATHQVTYMVPVGVSPDPARPDSQWATDLRLIVPVSKAVLLHSRPTVVLPDVRAERFFVEHVNRKFARPALHEALSNGVGDCLDKAVATASKKIGFGWRDKFEQARIAFDNALEPRSARVLIVCSEKMGPAEAEQWRTAGKSIRELCEKHGIEFSEVECWSVDEMPASLYRRSAQVQLSKLPKPHYP